MQKRLNKKQISRGLYLFIFLFNFHLYNVYSATINTSYYKAVVCKDVSCVSSTTINFLPSGGASPVTITDALVTGYAWGEELGWINFRPTGSGVTYSSSNGELSGYAWSDTSGWINFRPTGAGGATSSLGLPIGVSINGSNEWYGWAFASGKAGGWVKFDCSSNATCVKIVIPATPSSGSSSGGGFSYGGGPGGGWNSPQPTSTQATSSSISFSTSTKLTTTGVISKATTSTSTKVTTSIKKPSVIKKVVTAVKDKIDEIISKPIVKNAEQITKLSYDSSASPKSSSGGSNIGSGGVSSGDTNKDPTKNIFTSTSSKEKEDINKFYGADISKVKEDLESSISEDKLKESNGGSSGNGLSNAKGDGGNVFSSLIEVISNIISRLFSLFR